MSDMRVGRQVYGLELKASNVYLPSSGIEAIDAMIGADDETPITVEQGKAARSFIRQALGFSVRIERIGG